MAEGAAGGQGVRTAARREGPQEDRHAQLQPDQHRWLPDGGFNVGDGYGSNYMFNYDKDAKLVKVFGGGGDGAGQARDAARPVARHAEQGQAGASSSATAPTPGSSGSTSTARRLDATKSTKLVLFPAHAKTRGDVLLVPDLHARVSLFDKDNKPIVHLGDDEEWRKKVLGSLARVRRCGRSRRSGPAGKFVHPHDAAFDKDGNIFVVEWVSTGRVTF